MVQVHTGDDLDEETLGTEALGNLRLPRHWQGMGQSSVFLSIHCSLIMVNGNFSNHELTKAWKSRVQPAQGLRPASSHQARNLGKYECWMSEREI